MILAMVALLPHVSTAQPGQQSPPDSDSRLRALVAAVPLLDMERIELHPAVKLEGISSITSDKAGNLYVIHRPTDPNADPVVVLNRDGKFLRSWGKGMYTIPHGIEIDPDGNVWTTDANTSKIFKFTLQGKKLIEIEVGGIPDPKADFCSITDVAFSPTGNGHVFVADGYCNGRVLEYDATGKKITEWGSKGDGPGQFDIAHGFAFERGVTKRGVQRGAHRPEDRADAGPGPGAVAPTRDWLRRHHPPSEPKRIADHLSPEEVATSALAARGSETQDLSRFSPPIR